MGRSSILFFFLTAMMFSETTQGFVGNPVIKSFFISSTTNGMERYNNIHNDYFWEPRKQNRPHFLENNNKRPPAGTITNDERLLRRIQEILNRKIRSELQRSAQKATDVIRQKYFDHHHDDNHDHGDLDDLDHDDHRHGIHGMVEEEDDDGLFDEDEMGDDDWILPDDLLSLPIKQRIFGLQKKSALEAKKALLHNLSQTLNQMERKGSPGSKESDGSEERGGENKYSTEEQDLDPSEWRKKVLQRGYKTSGSPPGQKKRKMVAKKSSTGAFIIDPKLARYNFTHIGGYEEVKEELIQVTDFMRNPEKYKPYKVRLPRGILLYGAPGTGKTLFAKCVAGECNIAFIATSGSEFQEKYVGMGASRVRELFEFARQNTPCIIFIDEMDGIGRKRGSDGEAAQAERDQTLNQLLVEMDGYNGNEQIMVMGSTNRIDILDPALLRPGRLDKHIQVSLPDFNTRCAIIKIHLDNKPVNVTVEAIAKSTAGWSGAQIENLLNEVSLYGIRKNVLPVNSSVLETYTDYAILGKVMTPLNFSVSTLWRIAVHEMGHALVAMNTQHHEKPSKCSIISPNGQMAGYTTFDRNTQHKNEDDGVLMTREYLGDRMSILLGGRIAEEIIYGTSVSTGASDDLQKCLDLAKKMVMDLGMGKRIVYPRSSEKSLQEIDNDISDKIEEAYSSAYEYLKNNSDLLRFMSQQLLLAKTLDNQQMVSMIETFLKYKQVR